MNKKTIITTLLALVAMVGQGQTKVTGHVVNERGDGVDSLAIKQDSIAIRTDSLCQRNVMCNHDTIRKDSCQQHRLSFVRKELRAERSISCRSSIHTERNLPICG